MTNTILGTTVSTSDGYTFKVENVSTVTGDCNVTQRKGKTLCIFDMKVTFSVGIFESDASESIRQVIIVLPEFVHDQEQDDYLFEIGADEMRTELRTELIPVVKQKLLQFQHDLILAHDQDVKHNSTRIE